MSRTIADFPVDDASLYFRGTYCLYLPDNKPVLVRGIGEETAACSTGDEELELPTNDLCQWWPASRGLNAVLGGAMFGHYVCRSARRQTRRSVCQNTARVLTLTGKGMNAQYVLDLNMAQSLYAKDEYIDLSITALKEWLDKHKDQYQIRSCVVGRRLFYRPLYRFPRRQTLGQLYYSHLGMVGLVDLDSGKYTPVAKTGRLARRAQHSIERFLSC